MNILKSLILAILLLGGYGLGDARASHIALSCGSNPEASYTIWHYNFIEKWKNSGKGEPSHQFLIGDRAQRFLAELNAYPPVSTVVGNEIHLYRHDTAEVTAVVVANNGCVVVAGLSPNWLVEMWIRKSLNPASSPIHPQSHEFERNRLPFNPHNQEISYDWLYLKGI